MKTIYEALKTMTEGEFVANELKKQAKIAKTTNLILFDLIEESEDEIREYYQSHKHSLGV